MIRENEIFEEWVLYNMASRFMQLGIDVGWAAREYGNELNRIGRRPARGEVKRLTVAGSRSTTRPPRAARLRRRALRPRRCGTTSTTAGI